MCSLQPVSACGRLLLYCMHTLYFYPSILFIYICANDEEVLVPFRFILYFRIIRLS
jgi:hypothetical protein